MIFAFGVTFETPLFLFLFKRLKIVNYEMLAKKRRYAILIIAIFSAVITPTPDVYNMMLLAVPTYLLYEAGLVMIKIDELRSKKRHGTERKGYKDS
jgi:sec-independent protein translocase protein TatC